MLDNNIRMSRSADDIVNDPTPGARTQEPAQAGKRVLMVAFHFPPEAISSGIQRTLSFTKHLGRHGWEPLVLSAHPRAYSQPNPSQLASIPAGLVVRRAFAFDTKTHLGIKGRYPGLFALPDRWVSWLLGAVPAGLSLIRRYRPDAIWSTFPISSAHLIALILHRLTGLPWIADFRDPMVQPSYPSSSTQRRIYQWLERQAILRCEKVVFTTHSAMNSYLARFPEVPASKFSVIENGYDEDGFDAGPAPAPAPAGARRRTLVHSGVLYQNGRDPSAFLQAVAIARRAGAVDGASLRVILRASGDDEAIRAIVAQNGVGDIVEVAPSIPYREALSEMMAADGLLVFQGTPFNTQIPAKIYEYFRARKPILGLVDTAGETARVLRNGGFSSVVNMDDSEQIAVVLARFIGDIEQGEAHVASEALVAASSRAHRASQLAEVLRSATLKAA